MPRPSVLICRPARPCRYCGQFLDQHQPRTLRCPAVAGQQADAVATRFTVVPDEEQPATK